MKEISETNLGNTNLSLSLLVSAVKNGVSKTEIISALADAIDEKFDLIEKSKFYLDYRELRRKQSEIKNIKNNSTNKKPEFFSLWVGKYLTPFEWLCLQSYIDYGYNVTLYTDHVIDAPKFVKLKRFQSITPAAHILKYRSSDLSSLATFSDYFRYLGISQTGKVWIDTDNICLSDRISINDGYLFGAEDDAYFSTGVLGLKRGSSVLKRLLYEAKTTVINHCMQWNQMGPKMFTKILAEFPSVAAKSSSIKDFYPIHWRETADLFLNSKTPLVKQKVRNSYSIHIWNQLISRSGYDKEMSPPVGSYLYEKFIEHKAAGRFKSIYAENDLVHIIGNMK